MIKLRLRYCTFDDVKEGIILLFDRKYVYSDFADRKPSPKQDFLT